LLAAAVPAVAILVGQNTRVRYLLPLYPAVAVLVGWWAARLTPPASRVARGLGIAAATGAVLFVVALAMPRLLRGEAVRLPLREVAPIMALSLLIGGCLLVGLWRARRGLLTWGVAALTAAALAYGIWPYNRAFNAAWDFRGLAARVERHALGA